MEGGTDRYPFRAVIFDMDGVLVDTEMFYVRELADYAAHLGIEATREELVGQVGQSYDFFCRLLAGWEERTGRGVVAPEEAIARYAEWAAGYPCDYAGLLNPGAEEALDGLARRGVRCALASSSPMVTIEAVLSACGLSDAFEIIVSGEQFQESKPNPEIYLHTLERLDLPAGECCCVEDSVPGIAAGKAAGLYTIAKREERFGFSQDEADLIIDGLLDLLELEDGALGA